MIFIRPTRHRFQPYRATGIDWRNPLTQGLVLSYSGRQNEGFGPWVTGGTGWNRWTTQGSLVASPRGEIARNINGSALALAGSDNFAITQQAWSVWARVHPGSASTGYLISQAEATTGTRTGIWMSTNWQAFKGGVAGTSANKLVDLEWQDVVFTFAAGSASVANSFYKNGFLTGGNPWFISPGTATVSAPWLIGARWSSSAATALAFQNSNMLIAGLLMWERELTADDATELYKNPWQVFEPAKRRSFHFLQAAAGGDVSVTPDKADLTLTGYAPTITVSGSVTATPDKADLTLTGHAPTVTRTEHQTVTPGAVDLSLTGFAPSVSISENMTVEPGAAELSLTGFAPTVTATQNQFAEPDKADLTLMGYAPTVTRTEHVIVNPETGALVITGYAPTVAQASQSPTISPDAASLVLSTFAPSVSVSGEAPRGTGAGGRYYRYLYTGYSEIERKLRAVEKEKKQTEKKIQKLEDKVETAREKVLDYTKPLAQLTALYERIEKLENDLMELQEILLELEQEEVMLLASIDLL